jgi:hypothetical protein
MSESPADKPKIIVDEDWKSQVQAEKEALKGQEAANAEDDKSGSEAQAMPMPEASFSVLTTTLASQALVALGQTADPNEEEVPVNLDFAKHCIDTLGVLEEKTKGNLTSEESQLLSRFLHELRMLFVAVKSQLDKNPNPESPIVSP